MKVLLINTSERNGGAAIAASRLMEALENNGIEVKLLVRDKQTDKKTVVELKPKWIQIWKFGWERLIIWTANRFSRKNLFSVDIAHTGNDVTSLAAFQEADVIHLHWINQGMLSLKNLKKIFQSGKPVVWTMHDMWSCTGICHYARNCNHYHTECKCCPYLWKGDNKKDLSYQTFRKKKVIYKDASITFIACSRWLKEETKKSALITGHTVTNIPNPINTHLFKPLDKEEARRKLGLPMNKKLILFGSVKVTDERKGMTYLIEACKILANKYPHLKDEIGMVVFGKESSYLESILPFEVYSREFVQEQHKIVNIYNAVDVFVIPSLEENLPNMIMEAMACGVPCVGFQVGGIPEMIDHLRTGYVAEYKSAEDFARGIYQLLQEDTAPLGKAAREKVLACYTENIVAEQYMAVYNNITGKREG